MSIDLDAYGRLEDKFEKQVEDDRKLAKCTLGHEYGVYVPNGQPTDRADYVLVAMEPNFGAKYDIEDLERKKAEGLLGFQPGDLSEPLGLFVEAIKLYLCPNGETYWLTDVAKGAMPPAVAKKLNKKTWEGWYPLLLEEIELVGKPGCPVIAIGGQVEGFLGKKNFGSDPKHSLFRVLHFAFMAAGAFKAHMEKDKDGFRQFVDAEVGDCRQWPADFTPLRRWMAFYYSKRFQEIRSAVDSS